MKNKNTMRYHIIPVRMATIQKKKKKKNLWTINAGDGVEKTEPSYTVGGNVNWCSHYRKQYGGFSKY